jgi:hypothetical protein
MSKVKTRPENNFHCFEGVGHPYWEAIAMGHSPVGHEPRQGPEGTWWEFKEDIDGYRLQNGGMEHPQVTKLNPGYYFRFFGTVARNRFGPHGGVSGGWWIDADTFMTMQRFAETTGYSLARAAALLLVIPKEWHDCGYLVHAVLNKQMKAFVGRGRPATGSISPESPLRDSRKNPVTMGLPHLNIKQYFIPGSRAEIAGAFTQVWAKQVIRPGLRFF